MREFWFGALDDAADGVLIIDQEQRIRFRNQAACELLDYPNGEIVGSHCHRVLGGFNHHGHPICRENCRLAAAAAGGRPVGSFDMSIQTKSHGVRWLNVSTMTWPANGGSHGSWTLHFFRDVTPRKQREILLDQVLDAVQSLQNGEHPDTSPRRSTGSLGADLTGREREVLTLLAEGLSTRDIALTLVISPSTTRNHIRNIREKLHVRNRLEAVIVAHKAGLVTIG